MADSVGTLKTVVTASASGFMTTMNQAAAAAETGGKKIRGAIQGLSSIGHQMGGMIPEQFSGLVDFLANPKMLGLAGLGTAYGYIQGLAKEGREITRGAERTGMGAVGYQELGFAAKKSGSSIEEATAAVNRMRRAISVGAHGGTSAKLFEQLGMSPKDLSTMDVEVALERVAKAVMNVGNPMERARIEMELFGKSGAQLEPMLNRLANGGLKQFQGQAMDLVQLQSLESSRISFEEAGSWVKRQTANAITGFRGIGSWVGHAAGGEFVGLDKIGEELRDEAQVQENLKRNAARAAAKANAAKLAEGSTLPSALAPLAMQGSQAAYQAIYGRDVQNKQVELLTQIAANTSPNGVADEPHEEI